MLVVYGQRADFSVVGVYAGIGHWLPFSFPASRTNDAGDYVYKSVNSDSIFSASLHFQAMTR